MPLRIRDYGETHLKTDDDLFYFLQCATVASPKEPAWNDRAAEETYALDRFGEYLKYLEKNEWFAIRPTAAAKTRWTGKVLYGGRGGGIEPVLEESYPPPPPPRPVPPALRYTGPQVDEPRLG